MPCEPFSSTEDERLIVLAKRIAPDIAANVVGASASVYGFLAEDSDDLQIIVAPINQADEPISRDGEVKRIYTLWVIVHENVTRTDVPGLTANANLALRIAKRYPENRDLGTLSPPISGFSDCVVDDKQFFPFFDQKDLEKDVFHSVLQISFREYLATG